MKNATKQVEPNPESVSNVTSKVKKRNNLFDRLQKIQSHILLGLSWFLGLFFLIVGMVGLYLGSLLYGLVAISLGFIIFPPIQHWLSQEENQTTTALKKVQYYFLTVFQWLFGFLALVSGISGVFSGTFLTAATFISIGFVLFPPIQTGLSYVTKMTLSDNARMVSALALFILIMPIMMLSEMKLVETDEMKQYSAELTDFRNSQKIFDKIAKAFDNEDYETVQKLIEKYAHLDRPEISVYRQLLKEQQLAQIEAQKQKTKRIEEEKAQALAKQKAIEEIEQRLKRMQEIIDEAAQRAKRMQEAIE